MDLHNRLTWYILLIVFLTVIVTACGSAPTPPAELTTSIPSAFVPELPAEATLTPTSAPMVATLKPVASRCEGLIGQLEIQVLVGPADTVGLEPVAVGNVPFASTSPLPPYLIEGQGPIYYDAILEQEWGTYSVTMDMQTAVQGECSGEAGSEQLNLVLEMTGEQLVVVEAEGFQGEYPWSGTQTRELGLSLEEGATVQGEGWAVVLHMNNP
jgi:hypothetical protein